MSEAIDHSSTVVLNTDELRKGMYVSYLDRPWLETSFPFAGFVIQSEKELEQLRATCEYVFVQTERGAQRDGYQKFVEASAKRDRSTDVGLASWDISTTTEEEFREANAKVADFRTAVLRVFEAASRRQALDIGSLYRAAKPLQESVERCPDAALYAIRTPDRADYLYRHAVACAVMGMVMARALGLRSSVVEHLAVGCALLDVGKTRIPLELLNRPSSIELSVAEIQLLREHVQHSIELVSATTMPDKRLLEVIATHHERFDGRGYPAGLVGDEIPLTGRIAGIIDFYDAMISQRSYGRRATPHEAMHYLRQQRGKEFCPRLTDQFVQVFRLYPTGALVELSDGSVGRVIQQQEQGLLTPRVHLILDRDKERVVEYTTVDLSPVVGDSESVCVHECLKSGTYGIEA